MFDSVCVQAAASSCHSALPAGLAHGLQRSLQEAGRGRQHRRQEIHGGEWAAAGGGTRAHTHTHTHRNRKLLKNKVECLAATDTEFIWTENYQVTSDLKLLEVEIHTWSRVSCRNQLLKVKKHVSAVNVGKTISYCGFNVSSVSYKTHMSCQQDSRNKK